MTVKNPSIEILEIYTPAVHFEDLSLEPLKTKAPKVTVKDLSLEALETEAPAASVKNGSREVLQTRQFKRIGWRATHGCSADGARDVANARVYEERVKHTASSYCEIEDVESGERFRIMQRGCGICN